MKTYDYQKGREMVNPSRDLSDRLFSLFSHELRTKIACLQGAIDLLQMYQHNQSEQVKVPEEVEAILTLAADNIDRLKHLIENILDWHEIAHKADFMFKQPWDGAILIERVVEGLQPLATKQQIQIHLDSPACIPLNVDDYYLSRALSYLLYNAIKFSRPDREIWLTATVVQTGDSAVQAIQESLPTLPYVLIAIKDLGAGIPETALKPILQPFEQIDYSDIRQYGTLRLELTICERIIQEHQGKFWVESKLGQGSTFYVALPIS